MPEIHLGVGVPSLKPEQDALYDHLHVAPGLRKPFIWLFKELKHVNEAFDP